jgi:secretion/DNA translocation related CpaE-like protein
MSMPGTITPRHPLVVTTDVDLLDDVLRLAAAGGVQVSVAADATSARSGWDGAPFVLVGADLVGHCARAALPPRASVIIVSRPGLPDTHWSEAEAIRAEHIVSLPAAEPWLVDRLADQAAPVDRRGRVVAVLGGRGGAGASVLATGLAITALRQGRTALLVDADPLGGGVDLVLGWESLEGLRWPELSDARGRISPPVLVDALPGRGSLAVLSFDRGPDPTEVLAPGIAVPVEAMAAAIDAGRRGRELVVLDLPRRFDDAALLALASADRGYLVVPAELRACAAAARVAAAAVQHCPDLSVVVRGPAPGGLRARQVARTLGLPLAGAVRSEPGLAQRLERGEAPAGTGKGPLAELCRRLLADVRGVDQ